MNFVANKQRLDQHMAQHGFVPTRSQAESAIKLGQVQVNGQIITKPGYFVHPDDDVVLNQTGQYVSRAGLKLASIAEQFKLNFTGKIVLDVGSSTGGFTDYALQHGAQKVIAVDVGTDQLHPSLRTNERVELHEQTDIRDLPHLPDKPHIVVIDVSFISLREVLPHVTTLVDKQSLIITMFKPQFEAGDQQKHKGVIKNDKTRRQIMKDFETWAKQYFVVLDKADSSVHGQKGNIERFYKLRRL